MNNTQLDPSLSAMLEGTNLSIDPGALQRHQQLQPLVETDTSSSRTTSTSSVPRLSTPDTDDDDDEEEEDDFEEDEDTTLKKRSTRSSRTTKMPATTSKSKTRAAAASTASKSKRTGTSGTADKRRKRNLERNRAAASKCRQRKKQWQDGLERRKMELESRYKALHGEVKSLMEEVAQLKNVVMAHGACNDANIDDWIRNEADSFVRRMSTAQMQQNNAAAANAAATTRPPVTTTMGSMAHMQSPAQRNLTATPPMNDTLNNMFAPTGSKAPFDTANITNPDLRPGAVDHSNQNHIFNQDLLMVSSMQT